MSGTLLLNLEHLKLLHPKVAKLERGSGGEPDVTWQDVAGFLATLDEPARLFARYFYGRDFTVKQILIDKLIREFVDADNQAKKPLLRKGHLWPAMVECALTHYELGQQLTRRQKATEVGVRHWNRGYEMALQNVVFRVDDLDYQVRTKAHKYSRHMAGEA